MRNVPSKPCTRFPACECTTSVQRATCMHRAPERDNVLDGLSSRMRQAVMLCHFNVDRAERIEGLPLMDVALRGRRAVRPARGGKR